MFEFFRIWLIVLCAGFVVLGTAMALLAGTRAMAPMDWIAESAYPRDAMSESARQLRAWMTAVTGAVMAGWGLTLTILVANAFQTRQAWVWWAVAAGLAVWFALDTGRSIYHRVYANVALNTVLLVLAAIPLMGTIGDFH